MARAPLLNRVALGAVRAALGATRATDHAVVSMQRRIRARLNRARVAMMVLEMRLDEEGHQWARDMRAAAADGTLRARVDGQRPVQEIVDEWLADQSC